MKHFKYYSKADILSLTRVRRFETKMGEWLQPLEPGDDVSELLLSSRAKYVLVGVPEDIGVRANHGQGGADTAWIPFLTAFLNTQSNDYLTGDEILLAGHFDFGDLKFLIDSNAYNSEELLAAYRHAVEIIDEEVERMIKRICAAGKIPIVIGGGHNNAYPLIKGAAKGLSKAGKTNSTKINCINLDAQTDFRTAEGRHSGNSFRYAMDEKYLEKYAIIGVHENYVPQNVLSEISEHPNIDFITYEELFIHEKKNFIQAVAHATEFTGAGFTGIELDLDCIEHVLSSACTPCGVTPLRARQYVQYVGSNANVAYLHISEGACQLADGRRDETTGKLISYLVSDFVKAHMVGRR